MKKPEDKHNLNLIPDTGGHTAGIVPWPNPINEQGMYGIAGEFVSMAAPHTEADPNIILLAFLTFAGNLLGREYYVMTGADRHCGNLFLCPVGATGHGRKGSAISVVETFFRHGQSCPKGGHILHGISTGEGVIWEIHDAIAKRELNKKTQQFEDIILEENIADKRLLIYLSEFHQCIAAMRRQDSILSSVLRQAWDTGSVFRQAWDKDVLSTPSKNSPAKATGAHLSIIGCITKEELLRQTDAADAENGTLNRFLFACSRRSKLLPEGGKFFQLIESPAWKELQERLRANIHNVMEYAMRFERDSNASDDWGFDQTPDHGMYNPLSQARASLFGAVTVRAPQQVIRLSLITAAINGKRQIQREHQDAAYDQWRYCDESAKFIFGSVDDVTAVQILSALKIAGNDGLTRSQIYRIWNGKKSANDVNKALESLARSGIVRLQSENTNGRTGEKWFLI